MVAFTGTGTAFNEKLAVTAEFAVSVNEQLPVVLVQTVAFTVPLVQFANVDPLSAVAFRMSAVPLAYDVRHGRNVAPPSVLQVTTPVPVPAFEIVRVPGGGMLNVAVMAESIAGVNVHNPVVPLHPAALPVPALHPANPVPMPSSVIGLALLKA